MATTKKAGTGTKTTAKTKAKTGSAQVSKVKQSRQEVVRAEIKDKYAAIESGYVDLSKLLHEAYYKEYHIEWGYEDFRGYCGAELDVNYRKAMYLIEIWDKVKKFNLPVKDVEKLGWTKMKDIASVIDEKNAKEWMKKAKEMTSRDLTEAVKISRKKDTGDTTVPSITTLTLRMSEAEANIILDAIDEAKKLCESDNAVVALGMICQDWSEQRSVEPNRSTLDDHISYLEGVFGVKMSYKAKGGKKAEDAAVEETLKEAEKKAAGRKNGEATEIDDLLDEDDADGDDVNAALGL